LLHPDQKVRGQIVAEPAAFLHHCPEIAGVGVKGECRRVARARDDGRLIAAIRIKALDRRLGLGLDPDIAHRADPDTESPTLRVDRQMAVLMALNDAEDPLLGQHLRAIGAWHRLARRSSG
jgi:hypothetical protein